MLHEKYGPNTKGRDFVVGDIHGMFDLFLSEMLKLKFDRMVDRVFSVGDLVDRGPQSKDCLALVEESWFHAVKGNHEDLFIKALKHADSFQAMGLWVMNGGGWLDEPSAVYPENKAIDWFKLAYELPTFITVERADGKKIGICHAEPPSLDWSDVEHTMDDYFVTKAIWGRSRVREKGKSHNIRNIDFTVHGHTITPKCEDIGNSRFIDTGAFLTSWDDVDETKYPEPKLTVLNLNDIK